MNVVVSNGVRVPVDYTRFFRQDVTYWKAGAQNDFGAVTFDAPVSFKGRWENKTEELQGNRGGTVVSKAVVNLPEEINPKENDYLYEGISTASDPHTVAGAYEILQIAELPDLRNLRTMKVAYL